LESGKTNITAEIEAIGLISAIPSILEVICRSTGMGFAAVARVTEDKWVACAVRDEIQFGLEPGGELKIETTICNEIRQHRQPVLIDHVAEDDNFRDHHTPAMYGFQSYISIPITLKDGSFFGTLCAIDPKPFNVNRPEIIGMFSLFADMIALHLHTMQQLSLTESKLLEEKKTAELREHFIAILGHDLRNPVGAISNVAQLLLRMPLDERTTRLANILQDASYRMKGLIENILDFARGRMGDGIKLDLTNECIIKPLEDIIIEMNLIWPDQIIETEFNLAGPIKCDSKRIAQLFSNLLGNALTHGRKDTPVRVKATGGDGGFELSVTNLGDKIPDSAIERLFQPFSRGDGKAGQQGLGLGLYISSQIAQAHGGTLEVKSNENETCFTLRIPN
jgi:signal transduction histidine kinase